MESAVLCIDWVWRENDWRAFQRKTTLSHWRKGPSKLMWNSLLRELQHCRSTESRSKSHLLAFLWSFYVDILFEFNLLAASTKHFYSSSAFFIAIRLDDGLCFYTTRKMYKKKGSENFSKRLRSHARSFFFSSLFSCEKKSFRFRCVRVIGIFPGLAMPRAHDRALFMDSSLGHIIRYFVIVLMMNRLIMAMKKLIEIVSDASYLIAILRCFLVLSPEKLSFCWKSWILTTTPCVKRGISLKA